MGELLQSQAALEEEFYEKIEAPKFVDFTKPDLSRPDDRYWFCSRVGCDQKHEEETDHEAIYKDFVLRVMAARSPNVRLGKILNRNASGTTIKCPLTAPAKPSKSRLTRLAVISSFSHKVAEAKVKDSTPKPEVKQSSLLVKALTTPRNKNCPQNPNSFRSVRNPKATSIAVPKSRVVAKALIFHSPENSKQKKTSSELSVSKISHGMKQLQITSQRKRVLGDSIKYSRDNECDSKMQLPTDAASRRKFGARKVKSRVYDSLRLQSHKAKEAKSSRSLKRKSQVEDLQKCNGSLLHEGDENDSSDMEIDEKPRDNSMDVSSLSCTSKSYEGNGHDKKLSLTAHSDAVLPDSSHCHINSNNSSESQNLIEEGIRSIGGGHVGVKTELSSISDPDDRDSGKANLSSQTGKGYESTGGSEDEEKLKSSSRKKRISVDYPPENQFFEVGHQSVHKKSDENENTSASDDKENDHEAVDNDDKENASASEENRRLINNISHCERKLLGIQRTGGTMKKVTQQLDRNCKETSAAAGTKMVVKCKPKPTNPKPFRLRTDERGILKEANLERRLNGLAPVKENTAASKFPSQRRNDINIQRSEKCPGQEARHRSNTHGEGSEKEPKKITENQPVKAARKNSKGQAEPRKDITPLKSDKEDAPQRSSRKMRSSLLQKKLVRPHGIASNSSKPIVSLMKTGQLSMIKETSTISGHNEARKPWERSVRSATKAPASRSSSRGRRPTTIPKEPNFHSIHKPKSCKGNWLR